MSASPDSGSNDSLLAVEPFAHEFRANMLFDGGLGPYFAADRQVKVGDGEFVAGFEFDDREWEVRLQYKPCGLVHPGDQTPAGTEFRLESVKEYVLRIKTGVVGMGARKITAVMSPRWTGLEGERNDGSRKQIPVPEDFGEGVNLQLQGSNIPFADYEPLIREAADAVGISRDYFDDPHPSSNIQDAERAVRIIEGESGPVHARTGPIAELGHLLENDREGFRKLVQQDTDFDGEQVPGFYHTVTLGPKRVRAVFPDHDFPREIKHYTSREAKRLPDSSPLSHPKVGVSYQVNRWDETLYLDELDELERQLDQTLHSVLAEAGISLHQGASGPYIEDPYWTPENRQIPEGWLYPLDLSSIKHEQESVVVKYLADGGFSPIQEDALATLVQDGGEIAPKEIAEDGGWHPDSVRRALRKMEELVDREYGSVALRSPYIAELLYSTIEQARSWTERAIAAGAKVLESADRGLDESTSALIAWASSLGIDLSTHGQPEIEFGELDFDDSREARQHIRRILREGFDLWVDSGREPAKFRTGQFSARVVEQWPRGPQTVAIGGYIGRELNL